ncbi:hypothetical protein [Fundidesulfovibrio soli]|uniref:hypothetical protein n=1 Tax=Fundidesulfovibrio soli TaxID=2922716 RepID=UPI001FAF3B54|nr:hypothetical protein [Fundidesulfovibrio soli]
MNTTRRSTHSAMLLVAAFLTASVLIPATGGLAQTGSSSTSGPVLTLEQQVAIWDPVLQDVQSGKTPTAAQIISLVPQYGNWCGLQPTAAGTIPVDCLDGACMQHDLSPGYSLKNPTLEQVVAADRNFIWQLSNIHASTPYGELFRIEAIDLFTSKTNYEQANSTTLITGCSDCLKTP